ncbi:hypothetical protein M885DRAFT_586021 [Pelagophyceae sp. CCMP2097]|nr:hypothetical protein M885DRAFT_586021 [Pelagophyceae sp. CCMP2097]|mmetsp:Transcript_32761/g.113407  ORF Transcript_32761/g.113407 Transcript_32761/m.113407 type:complete len:285 (-) Transcript_32761:80-934(-)
MAFFALPALPAGAFAELGRTAAHALLWCCGYRLGHHVLYALTFIWLPAWGAHGLDEPRQKYSGSTLRRVATCRVVALVHAVASTVWSGCVLGWAWAALRNAAPGGGPAGAWRCLLAYDLPLSEAGASRAFMRHSLGYFLQDVMQLAYHEPDPIFFAHHLLFMLNVLPLCCLDQGWAMVAAATVLAESTNPLQMAWEMAKAFRKDGLYKGLSSPFTYVFALVRGILMPLCLLDMCICVARRSRNPVLIYSCALMTVGQCASFTWLAQLLRGYAKYRANKAAAKAA